MAFRTLTNVYISMRNNAIANRNMFSDNHYSDDRTALVVDLEKGNARLSNLDYSSKEAPDWSHDVDDIQFEMTKVKNKLKELNSLHHKHLNRPTLDDNFEEERQIDLLTQEITKMANQAQSKIRKLSSRMLDVSSLDINMTDKRLIKNVVNNLALQLQDLTQSFRKNQSEYLKKIQSRKERSNMLFDTTHYSAGSSAFMSEENQLNDENYVIEAKNEKQDQMNKVDAQILSERESEINHIVKSINDLNELFKDLATMIVDQVKSWLQEEKEKKGTVLDRIDCNIEKVSHSVQNGMEQLEKAAKYQKANRKIYFILVLAIIFILLLVLLVITKF